MLRINLLPIRQLKKRAKAKNQIASSIVAVICVVLLLCLVGFVQTSGINATQDRIAELTKEKKKYTKTLNDIKVFKAKTKELERRIQVINKLRKESSLTVHVLDELTKLIDNDRVWLTALSQKGSSLSLSAIALDNESIAQFMNTLKTSPYISSVNLGKSSLKKVSGKQLKSFNLSCGVKQPPPPKKEGDEKADAKKTAQKK